MIISTRHGFFFKMYIRYFATTYRKIALSDANIGALPTRNNLLSEASSFRLEFREKNLRPTRKSNFLTVINV